MFSKIPKWIKDLDDSSPDKALLIQISKSSRKPIETPREMNFAIKDFKSEKDAKSAADYAAEKGWECRIDADHRDNGLFWVEAKKDNYSLRSDTLFKDQDGFIRLAKMYDATYDGWYASTV